MQGSNNNRQSWLDYKQFVDAQNAINPPQYSEQEKQEQLASDMRIKNYMTKAVSTDNILSKALGISLLTNGYLDDALAQVYITGKLIGK